MKDKEEIPESLFKYRTFDTDNHYVELLTKNVLFFSSPHHFNDPFDCKILPNFETGTDEDLYRKVLELSHELYPELDGEKLNQAANYHFSEAKKNNTIS